MLQKIADWTGGSGFLPHGYCLAWDPLLLWTMVTAHTVIWLSYFSIPVALFWFVLYREPEEILDLARCDDDRAQRVRL